jgi:hypothetical protein
MGDYDPGRCHASGEFSSCHPQLDAPAKKKFLKTLYFLENSFPLVLCPFIDYADSQT